MGACGLGDRFAAAFSGGVWAKLGCVCGVSSCGSLVGVVGEGVICRSGAFSDKSGLPFDTKGPGATN